MTISTAFAGDVHVKPNSWSAVGLKVLHDGADHDVLHEIAYDTCKEDWPVVSRVVLFAFLEYGCNVCVPPVCWNNAC